MARPRMAWPLIEALDLYRAGWSYTELGEKYGVHHTNIMRAFKLRGWESRPVGKMPFKTAAVLAEVGK